MAKSTAASQLVTLVKQLRAQRRAHVDAIAAIDQSCGQLGISLGPAKRGPGRPKGKAAPKVTRKVRKRGTYKQTADDFILGLLAGGKILTTAQIIGKWRQAKRGGKADNPLSKLVAQKKLKRENIKGARGSKYSLA